MLCEINLRFHRSVLTKFVERLVIFNLVQECGRVTAEAAESDEQFVINTVDLDR
jgi:hypothetical protein